MSEESKDSSAVPESQGSADAQENQTLTSESVSDGRAQSVSYDTHRRLLSEKKKAAEELKMEREMRQKLEEEKMQVEGKKDELLDMYKKRVSEMEMKNKELLGNFAFSSVSGRVSSEASKMGCVDTEALLKLVDVQSLDVDENFNVDGDQVKMLLDSAKEKRPWLFDKPAPAVHAGTPKPPEKPTGDEWRKLSLKERAMMLAQQNIDAKNKKLNR